MHWHHLSPQVHTQIIFLKLILLMKAISAARTTHSPLQNKSNA